VRQGGGAEQETFRAERDRRARWRTRSSCPHSETSRLETNVVWRTDDSSPTLAAFLEVARGVFDQPPAANANESLG
jgi:hypothetical protein